MDMARGPVEGIGREGRSDDAAWRYEKEICHNVRLSR